MVAQVVNEHRIVLRDPMGALFLATIEPAENPEGPGWNPYSPGGHTSEAARRGTDGALVVVQALNERSVVLQDPTGGFWFARLEAVETEHPHTLQARRLGGHTSEAGQKP